MLWCSSWNFHTDQNSSHQQGMPLSSCKLTANSSHFKYCSLLKQIPGNFSINTKINPILSPLFRANLIPSLLASNMLSVGSLCIWGSVTSQVLQAHAWSQELDKRISSVFIITLKEADWQHFGGRWKCWSQYPCLASLLSNQWIFGDTYSVTGIKVMEMMTLKKLNIS